MIKDEIINKIKNNNLFKSIPESQTIQKIINCFILYFLKQIKTKYFLTILGDNILHKEIDQHHLVYSKLLSIILVIFTVIFLKIKILHHHFYLI